jgi:hypothetical protein
MATTLLKGTRWVVAPIAGALAALATQFAVYRGTLEPLDATIGIQSNEGIWAAKAFTSLFMGGVFVAVVCWVAPAAKLRAAIVALAVVAVWGGRLMVGGLGESGTPWLVAMGALGIVGGTASLWIARRSLKTEA